MQQPLLRAEKNNNQESLDENLQLQLQTCFTPPAGGYIH